MITLPRALLAQAVGNDPRIIAAFEAQAHAVQDVTDSLSVNAEATAALQDASFVTLAPNATLTGERVLVAGGGITKHDDGDHLTLSCNNETAHVLGGFPAYLTVQGATNLILPLSGKLATTEDIAVGTVVSFNGRQGAVILTGTDITTALTYTPTSVAGLTGVQTVNAFKIGLTLVKSDVGLGSVDNTADAAKAVLSAAKLATARTIAATGDVTWTSPVFDGSGNVTAAAALAVVNANTGTYGGAATSLQASIDGKGRVTSAAAVPITPAWTSITNPPTTRAGYGITDAQGVNANLTAIAGLATAADVLTYWTSAGAAALLSVPAAARSALTALRGTNTGDQTSITGNSGTATVLQTARTIALTGAITGTATSFNGGANIAIPVIGLDVGAATAGALAVSRGGTGNDGIIQTYTPTLTAGSGAFTTATATGRYLQIGKLVWVWINVTITANGTAGTSIILNVPVPTRSNAALHRQSLSGSEHQATGVALSVILENGSTIATIKKYDWTYLGGNNYAYAIQGVYEAA